MAVQRNLTIDQYSQYERMFTLYTLNHTPFDLTNYSVRSSIKKAPGTPLIVSFQTQVADAANGIIILTMPWQSSANVKPGKYYYDILITSSDNIDIRAVEGEVVITANITP